MDVRSVPPPALGSKIEEPAIWVRSAGGLASRTELFNTNHFREVERLVHARSPLSRVLFSLTGL